MAREWPGASDRRQTFQLAVMRITTGAIIGVAEWRHRLDPRLPLSGSARLAMGWALCSSGDKSRVPAVGGSGRPTSGTATPQD
jgi:hypothetical protein